jgi:hypothetical protein
MSDLAQVSRVDLDKAETACEFLLKLHHEHQALAGELPSGLGTLLVSVRMTQQDRARNQLEQAVSHADPPQVARMMAHADVQLTSMSPTSAVELARGTPQAISALKIIRAMLTASYPEGLPPGCLAVTDLEEVSWQELAARRTWLLAAIAVAGPGAEPPGVRAAALALVAVLSELDTRARNYNADQDSTRFCSCGFQCRGLAAIDDHLDEFQDLNDHPHDELTRPADHTLSELVPGARQNGGDTVT